jgi:hypothetical protein
MSYRDRSPPRREHRDRSPPRRDNYRREELTKRVSVMVRNLPRSIK